MKHSGDSTQATMHPLGEYCGPHTAYSLFLISMPTGKWQGRRMEYFKRVGHFKWCVT